MCTNQWRNFTPTKEIHILEDVFQKLDLASPFVDGGGSDGIDVVTYPPLSPPLYHV